MIRQQLKSTTRQLLASIYYTSRHFLKSLQGKVLILTYHRVLPHSKFLASYYLQPGMYVYDDVFEKHLQFLRRYFQILSFSELLDLWRSNTLSSRTRYCLLTFDDGWVDNYSFAYPLLRRYNVPATIFLTTGFIGTNQWFWPEKLSHLIRHSSTADLSAKLNPALKSLCLQYLRTTERIPDTTHRTIDLTIEICKRLPEDEIDKFLSEMASTLGLRFPEERMLLNWKEIEEMSQHSISFGSHSSTHKILTKLSHNQLIMEIEDSLYILHHKSINCIPLFSYPNGDYNTDIALQVKLAGYKAAVSSCFGFEMNSPEDLFGLKRIGVHNDINKTIPLFSFHISGGNRLSSLTHNMYSSPHK